jgi:hypothetical protein
MPADVVAELDTATSPYGFSQLEWSQALSSVLLGGTKILTMLFDALSTSNPPFVQQEAIAALQPYADTPELTEPGAVELYRQTACRDLDDTAPASNLDPVFSHGQLVRNAAQEGTKCYPFTVTTPYDSAQFPFKTRAYLFVGDSDVAAPPWQGAYQFDTHPGPVVRVITTGGGHLSLQLDQAACASKVLSSIAGGGGDLKTVLASCPNPVTVDAK